MRLSVIIPVHNGAATLGACLDAVAASSRMPDEVIVADDSSTDTSAELASSTGARVLSLPGGPSGPAVVRNRAAATAAGDVLVFVDADVTLHTDALARMEECLTQHSGVDALFGSYDDAPPARGLVTRYKNLLHHFVHQHGRREADTFWAGCAAVRRSVFESVGGFDESYEKPSIEDVEFGGRLRRAGHSIWLCPEIQGTHLKRWTVGSWLRTDIFARAVPWTNLILENAVLPNALNLDWKSRASALCAWSVVVFLILGFFAPWAWVGFAGALGALALLNSELLGFFRRHGGLGFAAGAGMLHLIYLLYSSLTYVAIAGPAKLARHGLILLLLVTLIKGIAWSVIDPPWQSWDEPQHFLYGQSVERMSTLQVPSSLKLPQELWNSAELAQVDTVRFHPERPIDLSNRQQIAETLSDTKLNSVKQSYLTDPTRKVLTEKDFYRYHPPLYYALLAQVQKPLESQPIAVRLLAGRGLSIIFGLCLVGLAWAIGGALWPGRPDRALLLGTLVSFQPMLTSTMATVTNSALETLVFSVVLLLGVKIIRDGMNVGYGFALGVAAAAGLLTKISFSSALPLIGLLLLWDIARLRQASELNWRKLWPWVSVALVPILVSGWWYMGTLQSGGDTLVTSYGKIKPHTEFSLTHYIATFRWGSVYSRAAASYWGAFGSVGDTHLPRLLQFVLVVLSGLAMFGTVRMLNKQRRSLDVGAGMRSFTILFLGAGTLCIILFYIAIDYRIAEKLGGHFGLRGQYYLPPIIGQMLWLMLGLEVMTPERLRRVTLWLLGAGMILLNFYTLFGVILPRYYGVHPLREQLVSAAVLQPVNTLTISTVSIFFCLFSLVLMAALSRMLFLKNTSLARVFEPEL